MKVRVPPRPRSTRVGRLGSPGGRVVKAAPVLTVPGFILSKTGLRPDGKPTLQQWREAGQVFFQAGGSLHWWIGDWLNYGERCYGNTYTKAMEMSGFDYQTCADDK